MNRNASPPGPASLSWLAPLRDELWAIYLGAAGVAAFAFVQSYRHIYDLGRLHAQDPVSARLLPLSVDLLIVVASLVLFRQSRQAQQPQGLARWLPRIVLWSAIGATVAANVAYGLPYGWLSAVISGWPGAVFAGVVEMVMIAVRPGAAARPGRAALPAGRAPVPANSVEAAETAFASSVAGGNPLKSYTLQRSFGLSRSVADRIAANGHGHG